jgi:hypothetical protein
MFKGLREKFGRLTDSQKTGVISLTWVSILEIVLFTWIASGSSILKVLFIVMMVIVGLANGLVCWLAFLDGKDEQKNVENLEE